MYVELLKHIRDILSLLLMSKYSRRIFVYFIKAKSEVFKCFNVFKQHVEKQTGRKIKAISSDNGREFVNKDFNTFLESKVIARQLTAAYTAQLNGMAERANRTLVEMADPNDDLSLDIVAFI